jgi:excisionase family DNA binding protein
VKKEVKMTKLTMTVPEAADAVGINALSLYRFIREGRFPAVRVGRRVLVPVAALTKWLEAQAEGSTPAASRG